MTGLVIPGHPWEVEIGWFDTVAKPFIDQAQPDELVSSWEQACAADDLLERVGRESVEFRRAIRWAERRIGQVLGNSKGGPRKEIPESLRDFDSLQKAQFRIMAGVNECDFVKLLTQADTHTELNRKQVASWCKRRQSQVAETDARNSRFDGTTADVQGDRWKMLHGDFRERLLELEPGTVDIIITDPPYPAEFLPLWTDLSRMAARLLKPQGVLLAMSGKIHLNQVMRALESELAYGWMYALPIQGGMTRIMARKVMQSWKPWLAFSNGPWPSGSLEAHQDTLHVGQREKTRYRWEQDPAGAAQLLRLFDPAAEAVVVDPFTGTAAFGVAALDHGCRFIGVEMDSDRFTQSTVRLQEVAQ